MSIKLKAGIAITVLICAAIGLMHLFPEGVKEIGGEGIQTQQTDESGSDVFTAPKEPSQENEISDAGAVREPIAPGNPQKAIVFSGTVLNLPWPGVAENAAPAPGVNVEIQLKKGQTFSPVAIHRANMETDPKGDFRFSFEDPLQRPLDILVTVKGDEEYSSYYGRYNLEAGHQELQGIEIDRIPYGDVGGEVVDLEGKPVAGVKVRFDAGWAGIPWGDKSKQAIPETLTDGLGRFHVDRLKCNREPRAHLEGYRQIETTTLRRKPEGGWESLRIVMAPVGSMVIRAVGAHGEPVPGVNVQVGVSSEESEVQNDLPVSQPKGKTDLNGMLSFKDIWVGKKLVIHLEYEGSRWQSGRMRERRLSYDSRDPGNRAIVVWAGDVLDVEAPVPPSLRIHGRVYNHDGSAARLPQMKITECGDGGWKDYRYGKEFLGDEEGRFEHVVFNPQAPGRLYLSASPADLRDLSIAWTDEPIDMTKVDQGEIYIELVLGQALTIDGVVLLHDGNPAEGSLRLESARGERRLMPWFRGLAGHKLEDDGSFRFQGLARGSYDLIFEKHDDFAGLSPTVLEHIFGDIQAGSTGLRLVVPDKGQANIQIEIMVEGDAISSIIPEIILSHPSNAAERPKKRVNSFMETHRRDGWPVDLSMKSLFGWSQTSWVFGYQQGTQFTFPPMSPGWYRIAVRALDEEKKMFHPTGTGTEPIYLSPGDYKFRFRVYPVGNLDGRVQVKSGILNTDLCVALVDDSGQPVPTLKDKWNYDMIRPTGADGGFLLRGAPVGDFMMRIGPETELRSGAYQYQQKVHIAKGENDPLVIQLP